MPTTNTFCAHCEKPTVVELPGGDVEIVGKSKKAYNLSSHWETPVCDNCDRSFGITYE